MDTVFCLLVAGLVLAAMGTTIRPVRYQIGRAVDTDYHLGIGSWYWLAAGAASIAAAAWTYFFST